jgi:hypothetical protein
MIFIFSPNSTGPDPDRIHLDFVLQSNRPRMFVRVQRNLFAGFGLLDNLFEQVDVAGEGLPTRPGQRE